MEIGLTIGSSPLETDAAHHHTRTESMVIAQCTNATVRNANMVLFIFNANDRAEDFGA